MPVTNQELLDVTINGFESVKAEYGQVLDRLTGVETTNQLVRSDLDRVLHVVDGNGKDPIVVRIARLETGLKDLKEAQKESFDKLEAANKSTMEKLWDLAKIPLGAALGAGVMAATGCVPI